MAQNEQLAVYGDERLRPFRSKGAAARSASAAVVSASVTVKRVGDVWVMGKSLGFVDCWVIIFLLGDFLLRGSLWMRSVGKRDSLETPWILAQR